MTHTFFSVQRSVPNGFAGQMEKLVSVETKLKDDLKELETTLKETKGKEAKEKIQNQIIKAKLKLDNHISKMKVKDDNKTVSLGTSKINYMDPRITVAWCKTKGPIYKRKVLIFIEIMYSGVPLEKIFNKSLLVKFPWAVEVPSTWRFDQYDETPGTALTAMDESD
jgi:DNA topoisomerase-1